MPVYAYLIADAKNLPTRAKNVLTRLGCVTIGDVLKLTPDQILKAKWAGKKVLAYIQQYLSEYGVALREPDATLPSPTGFPLLNGYFQIQRQIFDYFGYNGKELTLADFTEQPWSAPTPTQMLYRGKDFSMVVIGGVGFVYDNTKEHPMKVFSAAALAATVDSYKVGH